VPSYDGKPCFVLLRNRFRNSCVDVNPSFTLLNENVCFAKHTSLDEYLVVSHLTSQENSSVAADPVMPEAVARRQRKAFSSFHDLAAAVPRHPNPDLLR